MIRYTDIQARLLSNPEPQEVKDLRASVVSTFKDLEFFEGPHKYYLTRDGARLELPSVTGVVHQFEPPTDWDAIRVRKAARLGISPEDLARQWRETNLLSTSNGTKTHTYMENLMNLWIYGESGLDPDIRRTQYEDGFLVPYGPKERAGSEFFKMVLAKNDIYPVMPEARVHSGAPGGSLEVRKDFCGTFDALMTKRLPDGTFEPFLMDWKGFPLDTPILTVTGWKVIGELTTEDRVYDWTGRPTDVTGISETHYNPCYRMTLETGETWTPDEDHRWVVGRPGDPGDPKKVKTTKEIYEALSEGSEVWIPVAWPLQFPERPTLPLDPYTLGAWLGAGIPGSGKLCASPDVFREIRERGSGIGRESGDTRKGVLQTRPVVGLRAGLGETRVSKTHRIPRTYLSSGLRQRMDLLRGICDTAGEISPDNRVVTITVLPWAPLEDIHELVSGLGYKVKALNPGFRKISFNVSGRSRNPFGVAGHVPVTEPVDQWVQVTSVTEYPVIVPTRCIEVAAPSKTYLIDRGLRVTHNTNKVLTNDYSRSHRKMLLPPFQDLYDEPLSVYTLQLCLYQLLTEQLPGVRIGSRIVVWLKEDGTYEMHCVPDLTDRLRLIL